MQEADVDETTLVVDDGSRRPYVAPELTSHGSLARQAAGQPGLMQDGLINISFPST